jgi:hypothetical protein
MTGAQPSRWRPHRLSGKLAMLQHRHDAGIYADDSRIVSLGGNSTIP